MGIRVGLGMVVLLAAALSACGDEAAVAQAPVASDPVFEAENRAWRSQRNDELVAAHGWASLVGLHPIELKAHYVGSGPGSGIRLAAGPARLGMVSLQDKRLYLTPESEAALSWQDKPVTGRVELHSDRTPEPTLIGFDEGKGQLSAIERGGRFFLRVRHADAPTRLDFAGLTYWDADPSWRIRGRFIAHPAGQTLPIVDLLGFTTATPNPGAVEFERDGKPYRLEILARADGGWFIPLVDLTSGQGSYPAGRYLDVEPPQDGMLWLDFNRAHNPPSAFTMYATCPLPPAQNRLDLAIPAGEQAYRKPATQR
ncbi:DUF1684 domain-containing protein [Pseudoxanthomonas mexicana]|uniref:DUF1684 domain-containing protein n=1 Tax=Pseudoxanthomonas mexicana TaxID=128785 RepID=UPI00398B16B7